MNCIILIGFMASGKSTVGQILANKLKMNFIDTDTMIETSSGKSISAIFEDSGEEFFRDLETAAARTISIMDDSVVATGGGIIKREENIRLLKNTGKLVYLSADLTAIRSRLSAEEIKKRPLLRDADENDSIQSVFKTRAALYAQAADIIIDTDKLSAEDVAELITKKLSAWFLAASLINFN